MEYNFVVAFYCSRIQVNSIVWPLSSVVVIAFLVSSIIINTARVWFFCFFFLLLISLVSWSKIHLSLGSLRITIITMFMWFTLYWMEYGLCMEMVDKMKNLRHIQRLILSLSILWPKIISSLCRTKRCMRLRSTKSFFIRKIGRCI